MSGLARSAQGDDWVMLDEKQRVFTRAGDALGRDLTLEVEHLAVPPSSEVFDPQLALHHAANWLVQCGQRVAAGLIAMRQNSQVVVGAGAAVFTNALAN